MHITYKQQGENIYASAAKSVQKNGTVQKECTYIGRVIDKEKGIYLNKDHGFSIISPPKKQPVMQLNGLKEIMPVISIQQQN